MKYHENEIKTLYLREKVIVLNDKWIENNDNNKNDNQNNDIIMRIMATITDMIDGLIQPHFVFNAILLAAVQIIFTLVIFMITSHFDIECNAVLFSFSTLFFSFGIGLASKNKTSKYASLANVVIKGSLNFFFTRKHVTFLQNLK